MQKIIKQTEFKCIIKTCNTACVVVIVAHYLEYELKNIFRVLRSDTGRILFAQLFLSLNISYLISQVITAVNLSCAQHTVPNTHTHVHRDNEGWCWWQSSVILLPERLSTYYAQREAGVHQEIDRCLQYQPPCRHRTATQKNLTPFSTTHSTEAGWPLCVFFVCV